VKNFPVRAASSGANFFAVSCNFSPKGPGSFVFVTADNQERVIALSGGSKVMLIDSGRQVLIHRAGKDPVSDFVRRFNHLAYQEIMPEIAVAGQVE
jgi:hypothetical protein